MQKKGLQEQRDVPLAGNEKPTRRTLPFSSAFRRSLLTLRTTLKRIKYRPVMLPGLR